MQEKMEDPECEVVRTKRSKQRSVRRKKRTRVFQGHRKKVTKRPVPVLVLTASKKKLALQPPSDISSEDVDSERQMVGSRLFSFQNILEAIGRLCCPQCSSPVTVAEEFASRKGLVTKIVI